MRGEHSYFLRASSVKLGSSPHARGTPLLDDWDYSHHGIIPACAGNTLTKNKENRVRGDHPRMRGEHLGLSASVVGLGGSSPHARGTRSIKILRANGDGIIPACAGNTRARYRE